jgi:hypothetical protein
LREGADVMDAALLVVQRRRAWRAGLKSGSEWRCGKSSPPVPLPLRLLCVGEPPSCRTLDKLMDRTDASKDHLDLKTALILAVRSYGRCNRQGQMALARPLIAP